VRGPAFVGARKTRSGCRREKKEPLGPKWEWLKSKGLVEVGRALVLRVHHDREDGDGTPGPKNAIDRIGQQELTNTLTAHTLVARQPADQGGWNRVVARQLMSQLLR